MIVVVPAYNEAVGIEPAVRSLAANDSPKANAIAERFVRTGVSKTPQRVTAAHILFVAPRLFRVSDDIVRAIAAFRTASENKTLDSVIGI